PNETAVLPTILSRCQAVRFRTIPAAEGRGLVARRTGVDPERAAFALAACEGSVTDAVAFAALPASWQLREQVFACLADLHRTDAWGAISAGRGFAANWMAPVEALKTAQEDAKVRESEFLDKQAQKAADAKNKRALTAATSRAFGRVTALVRSWLADVLAVQEGMPERVVNTDAEPGIMRAAAGIRDGGIRAAVEATQRAERNIAYNVGAQNAIDALVLDVRRALYGSA
ncbi:MAG: DNA polymerase III subunit delta, partial [Eggerthellaceae bacterium]|nr:DNA polymerase III subunit delta [Eggerthellaceae bacterium]